MVFAVRSEAIPDAKHEIASSQTTLLAMTGKCNIVAVIIACVIGSSIANPVEGMVMAASVKQPKETRIVSPKDMSSQIVELAGHQELQDLLQELAEVGIDSVIQDGVLKDIPFLGTLINLAKTGRTVRDLLFMRKLESFLSSVQNMPSARRDEFRKRMERDPEFRRRVGENLLLRLERMDDMSKPEILGRAFMWFMEGRITYDDYQRLEIAIDRVALPDLIELTTVSDPLNTGTWPGKEGISYRLTRTGRLLQQIILDTSDRLTEGSICSKASTFELAQSLASDHLAEMIGCKLRRPIKRGFSPGGNPVGGTTWWTALSTQLRSQTASHPWTRLPTDGNHQTGAEAGRINQWSGNQEGRSALAVAGLRHLGLRKEVLRGN